MEVTWPRSKSEEQGEREEHGRGCTADSHVTIAPHLAKTVRVSGEVTVKDGMAMLAAADISPVR